MECLVPISEGGVSSSGKPNRSGLANFEQILRYLPQYFIVLSSYLIGVHPCTFCVLRTLVRNTSGYRHTYSLRLCFCFSAPVCSTINLGKLLTPPHLALQQVYFIPISFCLLFQTEWNSIYLQHDFNFVLILILCPCSHNSRNYLNLYEHCEI